MTGEQSLTVARALERIKEATQSAEADEAMVKLGEAVHSAMYHAVKTLPEEMLFQLEKAIEYRRRLERDRIKT